MYVLTAENMKKTEEKAVSRGHTFYAMMDMAGTKCAGVIAGENENLRECRAVILCGKGKNGGDGLVIAFRLFELGFKTISVVLSGGKPQDELCLKMFERMKKAPVNIIDYTKNPGSALYAVSNSQMIIDCLFGIGFKGQLRGAAADLVETANLNKKAVKYAVDIPSGLSADGSFSEGQLYFKTRKTLSMIAFKPVHVLKPAASFCGKTYVVDIGVSEEDIREHSEKYTAYTDREAFLDIKERAFDCNKGDFGRVLIIAGSRNMSGCVYLCAQGAVEAGAGLVTAAFPDCIYNSAAPKLNEPLMLPLTSNAQGGISSSCTEILKEKISSASVIALGCGMGTWEDSAYITEFVLKNADCPVIIDADGINCISKNINILKDTKAQVILTPHPGEMARLTGKTIEEIQKDRIGAASGFAKEYGVTLVLKGANTVIAGKDGKVHINTTGNEGMARGGSGDVLTGIIAAFVPQTESLYKAACVGVYIHGGTADMLKNQYSVFSPTPARITHNLHKYLSHIQVKE